MIMKEKLKKYFTKERIKKILLGMLWYAISVFCLWIMSKRAGGWTKDQWVEYMIILALAWILWYIFNRKTQRVQQEMERKLQEKLAGKGAPVMPDDDPEEEAAAETKSFSPYHYVNPVTEDEETAEKTEK